MSHAYLSDGQKPVSINDLVPQYNNVQLDSKDYIDNPNQESFSYKGYSRKLTFNGPLTRGLSVQYVIFARTLL